MVIRIPSDILIHSKGQLCNDWVIEKSPGHHSQELEAIRLDEMDHIIMINFVIVQDLVW